MHCLAVNLYETLMFGLRSCLSTGTERAALVSRAAMFHISCAANMSQHNAIRSFERESCRI
ncbi:hypothetical protein CHELA40_11396 [Chelatococcus asaccharovorans]|nr:hypothetical protein CHELA40_11396 [Chelatococcus asaccharovorans]CAH1684849.1 hypothetical protein CHELA17_64205 [Chelatococcus asaccharovorans]